MTSTYPISAYHLYNRQFKSYLREGVLDTISCDQVFSVTSHRFFPDIPVSSTNKIDQDITEQFFGSGVNHP